MSFFAGPFQNDVGLPEHPYQLTTRADLVREHHDSEQKLQTLAMRLGCV